MKRLTWGSERVGKSLVHKFKALTLAISQIAQSVFHTFYASSHKPSASSCLWLFDVLLFFSISCCFCILWELSVTIPFFGRTLEERAQRLFSTKGKTLEQLDPALFAKSKPGKAGKTGWVVSAKFNENSSTCITKFTKCEKNWSWIQRFFKSQKALL